MESVEIVGFKRNLTSKHDLKVLRSEGNVPGVIYGCGICENLTIPAILLRNIVYTPKNYIVDLNLNGVEHKCLLQDVQFHPVSEAILHVDFLKIDNKKKVCKKINIKPVGTPIGVKNGGLLITKRKNLLVYGLPEDIPSEIEIDITNLEGGRSLRIEDLEKNDKYSFKENLRDPIFSIKVARTDQTPGKK